MADPREPQLTHDVHPHDKLVVIKEAPFNAETAAPAQRAPLTPRGAHYVRCNFDVPRLDPEHHRVSVEGAVADCFAIDVAELMGLPQRSVTLTLECAGNGRTDMHPLPPGEPWGRGAVSTASWTGVPLGLLLDRAGLRDDVVEVLVTGADRGIPSGAADELPFARALPIDKARDPDVLVALEMNGRPLPPEHGAPARLIVPGWYGMASVKWVTRICALTQPFDGWFQSQRYVYQRSAERVPVDVMQVKSLLVAPEAGMALPRGSIDVSGWAWSGAAPIAGVEVSVDGGAWEAATLAEPLAPHAWRRFDHRLRLAVAGRHSVRARARDAAGRVQPDVAPWNHYGYGNNGVVPTLFYVV